VSALGRQTDRQPSKADHMGPQLQVPLLAIAVATMARQPQRSLPAPDGVSWEPLLCAAAAAPPSLSLPPHPPAPWLRVKGPFAVFV